MSVVRTSLEHEKGSLRAYLSGFVLSVVLTLVAYFAVTLHWSMGWSLVIILLALAVAQFFVQVLFFLHVGRELRPRYKRLLLLMMIIIVLIVVIGSVWIIYNLNNRMMPSVKQMEKYNNSQTGF
ncbi:MAG: cytochrome o ubiquinol oxidase subunit IV [Candidatus Saccharimonadales bacterium]